jgi:hypothetical protein
LPAENSSKVAYRQRNRVGMWVKALRRKVLPTVFTYGFTYGCLPWVYLNEHTSL